MFKKLLVPLDRSVLAEQALGQAAAIARASGAGIDVVLVHEPLPLAGWTDAPWNAEQVKDEELYLQTVVSEMVSGASVPTTHAVLHGKPADMICSRAAEVHADLVVLTSHGLTGLSRAWIGSVADGIVRHSSVPVLMLRPVATGNARRAAHHLFKHVLVPLDGSAMSLAVLGPALTLARNSNAKLSLLRVVQPVPLGLSEAGVPFAYQPSIVDDVATNRVVEDAKHHLGDTAARLREQSNVSVDVNVVVAGRVAQAILDFAHSHGADVVAMSTHGRGASRLLVGSVADKLLRGSGLPVMLQHPSLAEANAAQAATTTEHVTLELPRLAPA